MGDSFKDRSLKCSLCKPFGEVGFEFEALCKRFDLGLTTANKSSIEITMRSGAPTHKKCLTPRQAEILEFIVFCLKSRGVPPTHNEIASKFSLKGTYGVRQHLILMEKKGYLRLSQGKARGIMVADTIIGAPDDEIRTIPMVGTIAAGKPIPAMENIIDFISIGTRVFHGKELFALRVSGESMINAGIKDGDIAIINSQPQVNNTEIAAVVIDDEATLKRVVLEKNRIRLKAENDRFSDLIITASMNNNFYIAGKFVGLIRQEP